MAARLNRLHGILLAALLGAASLACAVDDAPPPARTGTTIETHFGTAVEDPYRWLEDTDAQETVEWLNAQNNYTRKVLDALPGRAALRERIRALGTGDTRVRDLQWEGDRLFYLRRGPGEQTFKLYTREDPGGPERLLVDPETYAQRGIPAAIEFFRASPNGARVAFGIADGGGADELLRVIDVATGAALGAPIPRARWSSPAWRFDGAVLFYTQQPEAAPGTPGGEQLRDSVAYARTFNADGGTADVALLGPGLNPAAPIGPDDMPTIVTSPVSPFAIAVVAHGVQREMTLYAARLTELRGAATPWRKIAGAERGIVDFDLRGEWMYVVATENAPRGRVLRWSLNDPRPFAPSAAEPVIAESARVVTGVGVAKDGLYVQQLDAGYGALLRIPFKTRAAGRTPPKAAVRATTKKGKAPPPPAPAAGERIDTIRLPYAGSIEERATNPLHGGALLRLAGWTEPPAYYAVDGKTGTVTRTPLLPPSRVSFAGIAVARAEVRSHDGVMVPVSILYARGTPRDGSARVLLEAYGAYGTSQVPTFMPSLHAWLERGGVYVMAHVRGGGELGEEWHRGGMKATKPNTWRDVIAVAEWLVRERWTAPARLAVTGSSAGGIAAGNAIVDRPDLFAALVSEVGFHDTLRSETGLVGPANVPEFGSVADEQGFRGLLAMSTYARLRNGVAYPAALFVTGFNDPFVDVWDPGKTAARLQAINAGPGGSGKPVLLRVDFAGGHGGGTADQVVDEYTDVYAFLLWQTGAPDFVPP